jgi:outer membrane protein
MQEENNLQPEEHQADEQILQPEPEPVEPKPRKNMALTVSLVMNGILLVGLAVLYFLFFTSRRPEPVAIPMAFQKVSANSLKVVYVNIDSLNAKYEFVRALKSDLEGTGKKLQNEILGEQAAFEKEAADFQKQVAANSITEERAKIVYEALMQKQQALMEKKDRYTQQVADKELAMNIRLLDTVTNFLKRYNRQFRFDYILGYKTAGEILCANDTLDITREVLKVMNREYSDKKK